MRSGKDLRIRKEVDSLGLPSKELLAQEIARQDRIESYRKLSGIMFTALLCATAAIIIITNLWLSILQIDGSSMNPFLQMDDIVIATRGDNPERNDVIAVTVNNKLHIKRVIAVAGDRVNISADGVVSVNGRVLDEPYVNELSLGDCDIDFPYQVPVESVFVLGDNRALSMDSRDSRFGTVSREQIIGRVRAKIWPL